MRKTKKTEKNWLDPKKQYLKKIRIYPTFLYNYLDKWLKEMSLSGWHIIDCHMFSFVFEKGEPTQKEYFTYGLSTQEGYYNISLRYPFLEKTYGVKKKKSKINSNTTKSYQIIEIDLNKIDTQNDVGYKELVNDRNRLYKRFFIRNLSIIFATLIVLLFIYIDT
jgi:hypothetical protein